MCSLIKKEGSLPILGFALGTSTAFGPIASSKANIFNSSTPTSLLQRLATAQRGKRKTILGTLGFGTEVFSGKDFVLLASLP